MRPDTNPAAYHSLIHQYILDRSCLDGLLEHAGKLHLDISLATTLELCADLSEELREYRTAVEHWPIGSTEYRSFGAHRGTLEGLEEKLRYQQRTIVHAEAMRKKKPSRIGHDYDQ